jgi:hypothetical protein
MNYVDTSLVISAVDTSMQSRSREATTLLSSTREKVVSELFLVELAASISRKPELISAVLVEDAQPSTVLLAYLVYLMSKYDLKLLPPSGGTFFVMLYGSSSLCVKRCDEKAPVTAYYFAISQKCNCYHHFIFTVHFHAARLLSTP